MEGTGQSFKKKEEEEEEVTGHQWHKGGDQRVIDREREVQSRISDGMSRMFVQYYLFLANFSVSVVSGDVAGETDTPWPFSLPDANQSEIRTGHTSFNYLRWL